MAEPTVTALPLGQPDDRCPLRMSGTTPVTLVRYGCRIYAVANFGADGQEVITIDAYSDVAVARYAFGRHPLLKLGAPATAGAA